MDYVHGVVKLGIAMRDDTKARVSIFDDFFKAGSRILRFQGEGYSLLGVMKGW